MVYNPDVTQRGNSPHRLFSLPTTFLLLTQSMEQTDIGQSPCLPLELIQLVLSCLTPRHLLDASQVCHSWSTIARRFLHRHVDIRSNRQLSRWIAALSSATLAQRRLVRSVTIHPQVHLDLTDGRIIDLCPWVESFDFGSVEACDLNTMLGKRRHIHPVPWRFLRRLSAYHSHPSTIAQHRPRLTHLMCSFDDLQHGGRFNYLVDLHVSFGFMAVEVATALERMHASTPVLRSLKIHAHSLIHNPLNGTKKSCPLSTLTSLAFYGLTSLDPGCYGYLLHKYPNVTSLHLGFGLDEFYLPTNRPPQRLMDLIAHYTHLDRLAVHFQGANEHVKYLWPRKALARWMSTCGVRHLDVVYERQTYEQDMLGLAAALMKHSLLTLTLNLYNPQSIVDTLVGRRSLETLCLKGYPGFHLDMACLPPQLRVLDLTLATVTTCHEMPNLHQLRLTSTKVVGGQWIMPSKALSLKSVVVESSHSCWDVSSGLEIVKMDQVFLGAHPLQWLKIHEKTADRDTWYNAHGKSKNHMHHGMFSLEIRCRFVEEVVFSH